MHTSDPQCPNISLTASRCGVSYTEAEGTNETDGAYPPRTYSGVYSQLFLQSYTRKSVLRLLQTRGGAKAGESSSA